MGANKRVRQEITTKPEFEGQWVIKSFKDLLSKSGYTGLRNNYLRRIDIQLRAMHFQTESIKRDAIEEMWGILDQWWTCTRFMLFMVLPIMLIINEEGLVKLDNRFLYAPVVLSWIALLITYCFIRRSATYYYEKVTNLK
jgi:hypothetical protein